ncbi:MAG TPA: hypothetical protein DHW71_00430 [Gammaproteobacteria bacterium]|nr:hypothetical protein [Gammaproteobacteria bacterium]HBF10004.1 hypothetical protein [Gammaproteobacteria bacterium]HCK91415.1 hypothetical protein [Gammaproteobacteria bacterium]|tara:strand:- start:28840 stop:30888 length:2049 start_codon:yes stop_codon:yes gene_type:complete
MSTIQSLGIGSGLNIDEIVTAIVDAERVPKEESLTTKVETAEAKISAYGEIKSRLSTLQSSISSLKQVGNFNKKDVSTDGSAFTATATSLAETTSYSVEVNSLAQSQSLASGSFASVEEVIGTGTLTIKYGTTSYSDDEPPVYSFEQDTSESEVNITIDSNNNSVSKLKDYINSQDYGFSASIINDGSGYRLVLSADSGASNSLQISVADDDGTNTDTTGLSQLAFDDTTQNLTQNVAAADANLSINGIAITSESNTVSNAVNGLTLTLTDTTTSAKTMTVSASTDQIKEQVESMIEAYNDFISYTGEMTAYSAAGGASLLLGDSTTRSIVNQLRNTMFSQVEGVSSGLQALSNIGILSSQADGTLEFDEEKFDDMLSTRGDQFQTLFSTSGSTTDSNIQFISGTNSTPDGTYDVSITQVATKGLYTGSSTLPDFGSGETVTIDDDSNTFTMRIDGTSTGEIEIPTGTYTSGAELASAIQSAVNGATSLKNAGASVTVKYDADNNGFTIESSSYGSSSNVAFVDVDTNMASLLGLDEGSGTKGVDVAGTINGIEGVGDGQYLSINEGEARGLKIAVLGGEASAEGTPRGTVTFTKGVAYQLDSLIDSFLDDSSGYLTTRLEGLDESLADYQELQDDLDYQMEKLETRLLAQFNAIDVVVNQLNATSSFLETALENLPGNNKD